MADKVPDIRFKGFSDGWEQRKLGDEVQFLNGRAYKQSELLDKGKYKVLRVGNFNTNERWYYSDLELDKNKYVESGDLMYLWATNFGPELWTGPKTIYHYHIWKLKLNSDHVDRDFLYTWLLKDKEAIKQSTNGTTMVHVTKGNMEQRDFVWTDINEQQCIGQLFMKTDKLITLHQRKLSQLEKFKSSLLQNLFPKNGATNPSVRFGEFTNDWEQRKLGDLIEVGSVKRIHQSDWQSEGIPFLRARDIVAKNQGRAVKEPIFISKETYDEYSKVSGKVAKGDLLVTGVGTIGEPYLISDEQPVYFKDGNVIWFKNSNFFNGQFLYTSFTHSKIQNFIKSVSGSGTVGTYTIQNGRKTPILYPTKEEQECIGVLAKQTQQLITLHQRKLDSLEKLKKLLLQKMFI